MIRSKQCASPASSKLLGVQIHYELFLFVNFFFAIFPFLLPLPDSHNSVSLFLVHFHDFQNDLFLRIHIF